MSPKESVKNMYFVELIKSEVEKKGVRGFAKDVGISANVISRYSRGMIGEPGGATLQKVADYFDVSVGALRGDLAIKNQKVLDIMNDLKKEIGVIEEEFKTKSEVIISHKQFLTIENAVSIIDHAISETIYEEDKKKGP